MITLIYIIIVHIYLNLVVNTYGLSDIIPKELKCEYLINPLAIETQTPRLSWILEGTDSSKRDLSQKSYQILVATDENLLKNGAPDLWDSNKVISNKSAHIVYNGKKLSSRQRCFWKVKVWDQNDVMSEFSSIAFWEMGLLEPNDWSAKWIGAQKGLQLNATKNLEDYDLTLIQKHPGLTPALYLRKHFKLISPVKRARLYATARGLYLLYVNGQRASDSYFSPGWTDYNKTIQYQAYDITQLLNKEDNAIGAILGTGWFSGFVGYFTQHGYHYGVDQQLLMQIHIEYENNQTQTIISDESWKTTTGPIIYSDILMGETYYKNRELIGWSLPSYNDSQWVAVIQQEINKQISMVADRAQPIRVTQQLKPKSMNQISPGVYVFDFGQNMVGWVRLKIKTKNTYARIQLRHAEVLNPNGSIYITNLRGARAIDTYVIDANQSIDDYFEPHFTYHGFRFAEISGYIGEPQLADVVGVVVNSDTPMNGKLETSNQMVNQLISNIRWGQRGNFFSVPTDCPQRNERIGWMGDAQVFAQTAIYNADVAPFYTKWMKDVRDSQSIHGGFSDFAPKYENRDGAPAWADGGVIVPYMMYLMYGDIQIIEDNYKAMAKYMEYIESVNPDFLWKNRVNRNRGDWLQINATTPPEVLATAYFAYDALLMSQMAKATDRSNDSDKYLILHSKISEAFNKAYVNSTDGIIYGDTQTVYLLALAFDLLPKSMRSIAADNLVANIKRHDFHLTTGFVGVGYLCPVLTESGHNDIAYRLLLSDTFPSWGYSIKYGATTIWERWDGYTKDHGFQDPKMNSFNHYSLGSIGRWLYQYVAGIDTDKTEVGFNKIIIKPNPGEGLKFVKCEYKSINGLIKNYWQIDGNQFVMNTTIPVNTRAIIDLSFSRNGTVYEVGSGFHEIQMEWR